MWTHTTTYLEQLRIINTPHPHGVCSPVLVEERFELFLQIGGLLPEPFLHVQLTVNNPSSRGTTSGPAHRVHAPLELALGLRHLRAPTHLRARLVDLQCGTRLERLGEPGGAPGRELSHPLEGRDRLDRHPVLWVRGVQSPHESIQVGPIDTGLA